MSLKRCKLKINQFPSSLLEATDVVASDREFLKPIFNDEIINKIIGHGLKE